jgi:hypothetical protein
LLPTISLLADAEELVELLLEEERMFATELQAAATASDEAAPSLSVVPSKEAKVPSSEAVAAKDTARSTATPRDGASSARAMKSEVVQETVSRIDARKQPPHSASTLPVLGH